MRVRKLQGKQGEREDENMKELSKSNAKMNIQQQIPILQTKLKTFENIEMQSGAQNSHMLHGLPKDKYEKLRTQRWWCSLKECSNT